MRLTERMVLLDDAVYKETEEIASGKREKGPLLTKLCAWFRAAYAVKVINIQFSQLPGPGEHRSRLFIILENTNDYQKMHLSPYRPNQVYQAQIALEFQRLAREHRFTSEAHLENLFVAFNDFSDEARVRANWSAADEVNAQIKSRYPAVWEVISIFASSVVFYYTDASITVHERSGVSQAITDLYYSILKRYDEFDYFTRENIYLKFDSKENLDKNYQGNLFYYTR